MDIVFQTGEFFPADNSFLANFISIIGAILGALISGVIAIYVFKKGLSVEKKKEDEREIKKNRELKSYLILILNSLVIAIDEQIEEITKTSKALEYFDSQYLRLTAVNTLRTEELKEIDTKDLYTYFITNGLGNSDEKAKNFYNLKTCIHYIDELKTSFNDLNNDLLHKLDDIRNQWNTNLKQLLNLYNSFALDSKKKGIVPGSDNFMDYYHNIMVIKQRELLTNNKSNNIKQVYEALIEPLKEFIDRNHTLIDQRIFLIINPLIECDKAFNEMKELRNQKRKSILDYGRDLNSVKSTVENILLNNK